ncbi:hypothetical protein QYF61_022936 [Mycteria americana]|uniref:Rna-directed dna polymerase from mobile element jockey-like n=1 Tax=Mycteria americana TaxID=33587 RepID=A0AAN7RKM2_MYCAM|nr:hypothetical protein QYF61_022936 [Mycteria americana]
MHMAIFMFSTTAPYGIPRNAQALLLKVALIHFRTKPALMYRVVLPPNVENQKIRSSEGEDPFSLENFLSCIAERLLKLLQPLDCYSLLLFQVGTNDAAKLGIYRPVSLISIPGNTMEQLILDTKLGGVADTPEGCVAIQRDLDRLEKWADRNLMKFNKGNCQVLPLGRNKPMHQPMLGVSQLERSLAEKALGLLVDTKLNTSQQHALVGNKANGMLGCIDKYCQQLGGRDLSPLFSTDEATAGVVGPVLGSSVQERHGHTGERPMKGHKDDEETGASL